MKKTQLFESHIAIGAKMAPVGAWDLPLYYVDGAIAEHENCRKGAAILDLCHAGTIRVFGTGARKALGAFFGCDLAKLPLGGCRYAALPDGDGGYAGEILLCLMAEEDFFLIVPHDLTAAEGKLAAALPPGVELQNLSEAIAGIELLGAQAPAVLAELGTPEKNLPAEMHCKTILVSGIPCVVARAARIGATPGFELFFDEERAEELWEIFMVTEPVRPAGINARESLRIESGVPAGKAEVTAAVLGEQAPRRLAAIHLEGRRACRAGSPVFDAAGLEVGVVTSAAFVPGCGHAVALALLDPAAAKTGTQLTLDAGSTKLAGTIQ